MSLFGWLVRRKPPEATEDDGWGPAIDVLEQMRVDDEETERFSRQRVDMDNMLGAYGQSLDPRSGASLLLLALKQQQDANAEWQARMQQNVYPYARTSSNALNPQPGVSCDTNTAASVIAASSSARD